MSSLSTDPLPANGWSSITYGNGIFVAIAWGRGAIKSSDGNTWTLVTTPDKNWSSVTYGNGIFVAVAGGGAMKSQDGNTWSLVSTPNKNWSSVTYGNGVFVAVAGGGGGGVMKSPDGNTNTWTLVATPDKNWSSVTYGNGLFVAVAWGGGGGAMTSPDGNTWTLESTYDRNWSSVAYGNGRFVATTGGFNVMKRPNGNTWSLLPNVGPNSVTADLKLYYTCNYTDSSTINTINYLTNTAPNPLTATDATVTAIAEKTPINSSTTTIPSPPVHDYYMNLRSTNSSVIKYPNFTITQAGGMTMSMWIYHTGDLHNYARIFQIGNWYGCLSWFGNPSGKYYSSISNNDDGQAMWVSQSPPSPMTMINKWYHMILTVSTTESIFYLNGVAYPTRHTGVFNTRATGGNNTVVQMKTGQEGAGGGYRSNFSCQEIRIYNRTLTQSECTALAEYRPNPNYTHIPI